MAFSNETTRQIEGVLGVTDQVFQVENVEQCRMANLAAYFQNFTFLIKLMDLITTTSEW